MPVTLRAAVCLPALAAAALLGGCDDGNTRTVEMRIDHYRDPCGAEQPAFCIRVLESSEPNIATPDIEGFSHEWGYLYEVVVDVTETEDGDSEAVLQEVVRQDEAAPDVRFDLSLSPDFVARVDSRSFELINDLPVSCATPDVCGSVAAALEQGYVFDVELSHGLVAHAVTPAE